jgi:hypothetical protein
MSKLPRLRGRQVIKALAKAGFQVTESGVAITFCNMPMVE